jgi:PKHD-type hydroxylase
MHHLQKVLCAEELSGMRDALADAKFEDGKLTAGAALHSAKKNKQLARSEQDTEALDQLVIAALARHPLFQSLVQPKRILAPQFARYTSGMHYGMHVDHPLMGAGQPIRTDVSITLFLSEPADYDGGELTIEAPGGARSFKLAAGDAIVYPTSAFHQVEPVTRGERLVVVTWAQSYVRDPELRQLLHDLNAVTQSLMESKPDAPETRLLAKCHANLLRKLAEV